MSLVCCNVRHMLTCIGRWNRDVAGKTFEDPDGYRVVFQRAAWDNANVAKKYRSNPSL